MSEQGASGRHGPPPIVRAAIVLTVIGIGGGTWFAARNGYVSLPGIARAAPTIGANRIAVTGTIESEESTITAEVSGRLVAFDVRDGDPLKVGQVIARIEDPVIAAQVSQAQASVGVAEANLAMLRAGTRPEEVRAAEAARDASRAQLATAQAQVAMAQVAVTNAEALRAQPQELDARIHQARVAQEVAVARLAQLEAGGRAG
ncbi:MAG: biotin/lipoyl-binding protein, partial [Proteobacteria bacterium]|nr:biotin/lipoyl-binding protein [Pseudomonadota bacterium]